MKTIFAVVVLFLISVTAYYDSSSIWSSCGSSDTLTINSVTINPDPPVKGDNVTVGVYGSLTESITGGNVTILIKYGIIYIVDETQNICLADPEVGCPINAGNVAIKQTVLVPATIPAGSYDAGVVGVDENENQIFCVNVTLNF